LLILHKCTQIALAILSKYYNST